METPAAAGRLLEKEEREREKKKNPKRGAWISLNSGEEIPQARARGVQGLAQRCISNVSAQLQMSCAKNKEIN